MGTQGKASVQSAVAKLEGSTVKTRGEGLDELRRIFNRGTSWIDEEKTDNVFHSILESLFRIIQAERQAYLKAVKSTTKSSNASRLETAATAFRLVVDKSVFKFGQKTVSAVLDHIVDTVPGSDTTYCTPIQLDYLKSFRTILEYPSHVEHLRPKQWQSYVDFVLDGLSQNLDDDFDDAASTQSRQMSVSFRAGPGNSGRASQRSNGRESQALAVNLMGDLLASLTCLTRTSNAPWSTRLVQISETLLTCITNLTRYQESAFEVLNYLLPVCLTENFRLALAIFARVCNTIQRLWNTNSTALREQMLITLFYSRFTFLNPRIEIHADTLESSMLDSLVGAMWSEMEKRTKRDLLQLEDLSFIRVANPPPLSLKDILPASDSDRITTTWSTLLSLAHLLVGLDKLRHPAEQVKSAEIVNKRQRLEHSLEDIFLRTLNGVGSVRVVALQIALFTVNVVDDLPATTLDHVSRLDSLLIADDPWVSSWTMVLLARCTGFQVITTPSWHGFWQRIWTAASRAASNTSSSRYACYLMTRLIESNIVDKFLLPHAICNSIFTDASNGPAAFTDAAMLLLTGTLRLTLAQNERLHKYFAGRTLSWLEARWFIPMVPDQHHNSQTATYGQPYLLVSLFTKLTGTTKDLDLPEIMPFAGVIHRASYIDTRDLHYTRFMNPENGRAAPQASNNTPSIHTYSSLSKQAYLMPEAVADFFSTKLKAFLATWNFLTAERISNVNSDIAEVVTTACIVSSAVNNYHASNRSTNVVEVATREIFQIICDFCLKLPGDAFEEFSAKIGYRLLQLRCSDEETFRKLSQLREHYVIVLLTVMDMGPEAQDQLMGDTDFIDSFDVAASQNSQSRPKKVVRQQERSDLPYKPHDSAIFVACNLALRLDVLYAQNGYPLDAIGMVSFTDKLVRLDADGLFITRSLLRKVLDTDVTFSRSDASRIVKKYGETFLRTQTLERCEAALSICSQVLTKLTPLWTTDDEDPLANSSYDIYEWFIAVALRKSVASQQVLRGMSCMIEAVLKFRPSYGGNELPSPRTVLLEIFGCARTGLKFEMAGSLSRLFEGYILSEHTAIFDDIVDNLPSDPDDTEGIAVRLYILAYLGARWHTILRQAVYHIFETAVHVPSTSSTARKCVQMMCDTLQLKDCKDLFRLFSSQLFYTWLENESIDQVPYHIFGYVSLTELIQDAKDEVIAQVVMRASSKHIDKIAAHLAGPVQASIGSSFARVAAYAIIADMSISRTTREFGKAETFLLKYVDENKYPVLLSEQFPSILGIIMSRLTDDKGFDKSCRDANGFQNVAEAFEAMCNYSSSKMDLPPGQQPTFRAKHLLPILAKLSAHSLTDQGHFATAPILTSVCRYLLDDTHPALGPLHACATFRKVRVAISMAGSAALQGYPLEMLLHNIRPYMILFHSSEDVLGIVWYLFQYGREHLRSQLSFVTGIGVTMFASLSHFLASPQDSTTQESQFTSTVSKAKEFRQWLGQYFQALETTSLSPSSSTSFYEIIDAARKIEKRGNNSKLTPEGLSLFFLLLDQASKQPLLAESFFQHILQVLCYDFTVVAESFDDILADDRDLELVTPVLWRAIRDSNIKGTFREWLGQSLGRSTNIIGPEHVVSISTPKRPAFEMDKTDLGSSDSYFHIISVLMDHLWWPARKSVSAAEETLQSIFSSISSLHRAQYLKSEEAEVLFRELRFESDTSSQKLKCIQQGQSRAVGNAESTANTWARGLVLELCERSQDDPVLSCLPYVLNNIPTISSSILSAVTHLVLLKGLGKSVTVCEHVSTEFTSILGGENEFSKEYAALVLDVISYLRRCAMPSETTMAQRLSWLQIDFHAAANAACNCGRYNDALLLLEIHASQHSLKMERNSKRSSTVNQVTSEELLSKVYLNIDDPDFFYGTSQDASITSIVGKLYHEGAGKKALSFQSAVLDSRIKTHGLENAARTSNTSTLAALNLASLHGLASLVERSMEGAASQAQAVASSNDVMNLDQWDVGTPFSLATNDTEVAKVLTVLASASQRDALVYTVGRSILQLAGELVGRGHRKSSEALVCSSLAVLATIRQAIMLTGCDEVSNLLTRKKHGKQWTEHTSFELVEKILVGKEALVSAIRSNPSLRDILKMTPQEALVLELRTLRSSLAIGRNQDMAQFCLSRTAYMSDLIQPAASIGIKVDAAIEYDLANTFWTHEETAASITLLQNLITRPNLQHQAITISQSEILTNLGQKLTQARLDRPDEITSRYLQPAIQALSDSVDSSTAGRVYHNFAAFCDQQLKDADNLEEYRRVEKLRDRKKQEVRDLEHLKKSKEGKERDQIRGHLAKAQTWFKLDEQELKRLREHREGLISNCLENYLKAMRACEDFPNDVLRFLALWLEQAQNEDANVTVDKYLQTVPSYKLAPLMNQLSSRILDNQDVFQRILFELMFRICNEHPYHSLYQVFATSKSKGQKSDTVATSRHKAATKLSETVMRKGAASAAWIAIHNSNIAFVRVVQEKLPDKEFKTGSKFMLRKLPAGAKLEQAIQDLHQKIPPPTSKIALRANADYSTVPTLLKFEQYITIAGGISAPKIVTAIATDGSRQKMLLKGGNDDLRQDSIMEQVFEQVSNLLQDHRLTRQRNLGIRTYKVIPLTHNAGIIEFVQNTMPLHDYILPAHARYYPKDYKHNRCRKEISDAQTKSLSQRLQAYRNVTANFHPVMRFFFMEYFLDPDDWFEKRRNYSRSTAAISMLGHVLGIGDRHGHNILLDTRTGEVVHIDLGVAFEAGRVLPVPEVVPFRLTRDLVDAMGISGVEGVFRRCCNFTLEALRRDQEAIMTILDVLRWDPLYSWSISPLRLQKMQENQEQAAAVAASATTSVSLSTRSVVSSTAESTTDGATKLGDSKVVAEEGLQQAKPSTSVNEPGEADRALAVVARKLGKSLSVEATVNDLIRQATDERNLAVLYCGWAAYA